VRWHPNESRTSRVVTAPDVGGDEPFAASVFRQNNLCLSSSAREGFFIAPMRASAINIRCADVRACPALPHKQGQAGFLCKARSDPLFVRNRGTPTPTPMSPPRPFPHGAEVTRFVTNCERAASPSIQYGTAAEVLAFVKLTGQPVQSLKNPLTNDYESTWDWPRAGHRLANWPDRTLHNKWGLPPPIALRFHVSPLWPGVCVVFCAKPGLTRAPSAPSRCAQLSTHPLWPRV